VGVVKIKTKPDYEYVHILKEIDLQKFRKRIDTCPECKRIVRIRTDHYHAEQLCEKCGAVIREQLTLPELPEICVTDRELEIELNTYRSKKTRPLDKTRIGGLTRYKSLIQKYDRSTEGNKKKWRNKMLNQKRITEEQVEWWIGSDHLSPSELIELLTTLINGEYTIPNFRADVLEFSEDTNHA